MQTENQSHSLDNVVRLSGLHFNELPSGMRGKHGWEAIAEYLAGPNNYHFVNNSPVARNDALGLLQVCYRPIGGQCWMGDVALFWHSYLLFSDGTVDDVGHDSGADDYCPAYTYCYDIVRTDECGCKTDDEIEECVRQSARDDYGGYRFITHNCGDFTRQHVESCCLENPTPWWLVY